MPLHMDFEIMYYSSDISFDEYTQTFKNGYGSIVSYMMHPKKIIKREISHFLFDIISYIFLGGNT